MSTIETVTDPEIAAIVGRELAALRDYARKASIAFMRLSGGGSEMFLRIGEEFYADPKLCADRTDEKIATVRRLHGEALAKIRDVTARAHLQGETK